MIFILLLGSCSRGGTWGAEGEGGGKNFSVGICDGAPLTSALVDVGIVIGCMDF